MTAGWQYFWPLFAAGLALGLFAGLAGSRSGGARRRRAVAIGCGAALASALLWHGPLGAGERFSRTVEHEARFVLDDWEMPQVSARLQRGPLTRRLDLAGPADAFQRGELVRLMDLVPGVRGATWSKSRAVPLVVEAAALSLLGFLLGLLLAYLIELRRRYNKQWSW